MSKVKRLPIFMADSSLDFLDVMESIHDEVNFTLSSCVNLCVQFAKLSALQPLPLAPNELLFCCDILNGGAQLTEFKAPSDVSIEQSLNSMFFGLKDAVENNYGGEIDKWDISNPQEFIDRLNAISKNLAQAWALAIATRQFWAKTTIEGRKPLNECEDYREWAVQWVA